MVWRISELFFTFILQKKRSVFIVLLPKFHFNSFRCVHFFVPKNNYKFSQSFFCTTAVIHRWDCRVRSNTWQWLCKFVYRGSDSTLVLSRNSRHNFHSDKFLGFFLVIIDHWYVLYSCMILFEGIHVYLFIWFSSIGFLGYAFMRWVRNLIGIVHKVFYYIFISLLI